MRVEFVIDELVLIGFDPRDRHRIADAIEAQLTSRVRDVSVSRFVERSHETRTTLRGPDVRLSTSGGRVDAKVIGDGVSRSIVSAVAAASSSARKR